MVFSIIIVIFMVKHIMVVMVIRVFIVVAHQTILQRIIEQAQRILDFVEELQVIVNQREVIINSCMAIRVIIIMLEDFMIANQINHTINSIIKVIATS